MTTLRWELFLTETSRPGTCDLGIAYEVPDQQTNSGWRKIAAFRRLHRQCLRDKLPRDGALRAKESEEGSLVIRGARVIKLCEVQKRARYSGAAQTVSYKLYFASSEDAHRLAKVVGFGSCPSMENGSWCFTMPTRIRDDTDEWEKYLNPVNDRTQSRKHPGL